MSYRKLKIYCFCLTWAFLAACTDSGGVSTLGDGNAAASSSSTGSVVSSSGSLDTFDYGAMLSQAADSTIIKNYGDFVAQGEEFKLTLTSFCTSINSEFEGVNRSSARNSWTALMNSWQAIEVHQIGPVNNNTSFRNRIHFYDKTSGVDSCLVDRNVNRARYDDFDISVWTYPSRGLEVMEYLLFQDSLSHTCPTANEQTEEWGVLTDDSKKRARCFYAQLALDDIVDAASQIHLAWLAEGGNYRERFIRNDAYESIQAMSDALFYLEKFTKDIKLGITTGLKGEGTGDDYCENIACPKRVESPYSKNSLENIRINIESFWRIYTGGEGVGFDDLIAAKGLETVNQAFSEDVSAALALVNAMILKGDTLIAQTEGILQSGVKTDCVNSQANPDSAATISACSLHGLVKRISDRLRTDFILAVNVSLPQSAQSDAD